MRTTFQSFFTWCLSVFLLSCVQATSTSAHIVASFILAQFYVCMAMLIISRRALPSQLSDAENATGRISFKRFDPFAIPKKKLIFVLAQFFSVGFIPFLSWRATLITLPAFGISMVSKQPMMNSLGH